MKVKVMLSTGSSRLRDIEEVINQIKAGAVTTLESMAADLADLTKPINTDK